MTDEEIEKGLRNLSSIDLTYEANYDSCGRLIPPRGMMIIQAALDYINRLKAENESKENCTIEQHAEIHKLRDELKQIRKDTAKEIFKTILDDYQGVYYYDSLFDGLQAIADDNYGIRIMPSEDGFSVEVYDE